MPLDTAASTRASRGARITRSTRTALRGTGRTSLPPSAVVLIDTVPSGLGTSEMCRRSSASSSGANLWVSIWIAVPS